MSTAWTDPDPTDVLPEVRVLLVGPGETGQEVPTETWDLTRELVSTVLPGSLRERSGLSIGSGSATVPTDPIARTPWAASATRVRPGGRASVRAVRGSDGWSLGAWAVGPKGGSLRSGAMSIDLIEQQWVGRGAGRSVPNALPGDVYPGIEPAWMVDALARQMGWWTTPPPVQSCIMSVPMNGAAESETPRAGAFAFTLTEPGWGGVRGALGMTGEVTTFLDFPAARYEPAQGQPIPIVDPILTTASSIFVTLDVVNEVVFVLSGPSGIQGFIRIRPAQVAVRLTESETWQTATVTPGQSPLHPRRIQVEIQRNASGVDPDDPNAAGTYGPLRARARTSATAAWSSWATRSGTYSGTGVASAAVQQEVAGASWCGLQITTQADPALWNATSADIDPLGGMLLSAFLPAATDPWSGIQEVVGSWLGAAWIDRGGILRCRNRTYLSGAAPIARTIDVGTRVEDLPWKVDPADLADRMVCEYSPVDIVQEVVEDEQRAYPILWESPEAVEVGPGATVELQIDLDRVGYDFYTPPVPIAEMGWGSAEDPAYNERFVSTWMARVSRDGSGAIPSTTALRVTAQRLSAGRARIRIQNTTGQRLFTVNDEGQPHLVMRGYMRLDQENTATIERGLDPAVALNPMTVNFGIHVQRRSDAEALTDHLWNRAAQPGYRVDSVRVVPDWRTDIGDIIRLTHERSDLEVKALVVKVAMSGQSGQITQVLDLVMLPWTLTDTDARWASRTVASLDSALAGLTVADVDDDPMRLA